MELALRPEEKPLGLRGLTVSWLVMAATAAPLWIWMDGRYGILKALFFALFFALTYRIKRSTLDVAVFTLIMTGLQVFSRQTVDIHQAFFDAYAPELLPVAAHVTLSLFSAWLMSWLFDLRGTPGPTYTCLAAYFIMFYFAAFILHVLGVMFWDGIPLSYRHFFQFAILMSLPPSIWWLGTKVIQLVVHFIPPLKEEASWKRRFRDFENTRAVVVSCLVLFAADIVWFGFVHFAIAKLGLAIHYNVAEACPSALQLGSFIHHSFWASIGMNGGCLSSGSLLSRGVDYLEVIVSLFLFLVLVQALALAFSAQGPDQPPERKG